MTPAKHFEHVFEMAHELQVSVAFSPQTMFLQPLGHAFALQFKQPKGGRPAFTLLWKNELVYAAVDGWLLDDEGEVIAEGREPQHHLGHLVFTSIFQHALYLDKARR